MPMPPFRSGLDSLPIPEEIVVKAVERRLKDMAYFLGHGSGAMPISPSSLDPGSIAIKTGVYHEQQRGIRASRGRGRAEERSRTPALILAVEVRGVRLPVRWPTCCASSTLPLRESNTLATAGTQLRKASCAGRDSAAFWPPRRESEAQLVVVVLSRRAIATGHRGFACARCDLRQQSL